MHDCHHVHHHVQDQVMHLCAEAFTGMIHPSTCNRFKFIMSNPSSSTQRKMFTHPTFGTCTWQLEVQHMLLNPNRRCQMFCSVHLILPSLRREHHNLFSALGLDTLRENCPASRSRTRLVLKSQPEFPSSGDSFLQA